MLQCSTLKTLTIFYSQKHPEPFKEDYLLPSSPNDQQRTESISNSKLTNNKLTEKNISNPRRDKLSSNDRKLARLYDTVFFKITISHMQSITRYLAAMRWWYLNFSFSVAPSRPYSLWDTKITTVLFLGAYSAMQTLTSIKSDPLAHCVQHVTQESNLIKICPGNLKMAPFLKNSTTSYQNYVIFFFRLAEISKKFPMDNK